MNRAFVRLAIGGAALLSLTMANAQAGRLAAPNAGVAPAADSAALPAIPPLPAGKSTILGGSIRDVDPVRDQFTLQVYGIKPLKILFDERTQVFRDGKKVDVDSLGSSSHASVQTTLDEGRIFALSIHILSKMPQGDYQGQVVRYDPENGELILSAERGGRPFSLLVTNATSIARQGQSAFSSERSGTTDLEAGALVSVKFDSDAKGKGVAREITVLATPGATFLFSGNLTSLDVPAGILVLVDPRYNRSYQISFDSHSPDVQNLHVGQHVRVSADYDGHRYVATEITVQ